MRKALRRILKELDAATADTVVIGGDWNETHPDVVLGDCFTDAKFELNHGLNNTATSGGGWIRDHISCATKAPGECKPFTTEVSKSATGQRDYAGSDHTAVFARLPL